MWPAGLPVVAHLRDTQNYVQAAAQGAQDAEQWQPLLRWAELL
jgi:chromosome partitioning protein